MAPRRNDELMPERHHASAGRRPRPALLQRIARHCAPFGLAQTLPCNHPASARQRDGR